MASLAWQSQQPTHALWANNACSHKTTIGSHARQGITIRMATTAANHVLRAWCVPIAVKTTKNRTTRALEVLGLLKPVSIHPMV